MIKERINKIYLYRHTLWSMAISQFKRKYAGSFLGIWWAVLTPLILAASINFIFTVVSKIDVPNYTIFALSGIMPWFFFSNSLMEATNSFVANSTILKQSIFPREFIPIATVISNLLIFILGLAFLFPLFIIFNFRVAGLSLYLFIIIIIHFIFIVGLGLLFSSVNVFFHDLTHFLSVGMMIWFWLTPIFFPLDMFPISFRWIYFINPMTRYVILYQNILFKNIPPNLTDISIAFLISLLFLFIGYFFFLKKESALLKII